MGVGECAGEVVSPIDFGLAAAEREVFEAQLALEKGEVEQAGKTAYHSMLHAAKALVKSEYPKISTIPTRLSRNFGPAYYDTQKFWDPFAGGKFASYLFAAQENSGHPYTEDSTPLSDRRSAAFHRRRPQLQQPDGYAGGRLAAMNLQHVNVKLLIEDSGEVDLEPLIPIFHRWIQDRARPELLLDIADYRHVPDGPGVVLIGHDANYSVDNTDNRLGVRYNRKAASPAAIRIA